MQRIIIPALLLIHLSAVAQKKPADTLVVKVGQASKVIFAIQDKKDLETLKKYNFQSLLDDMIVKLEKKDTSKLSTPSSVYLKDTTKVETVNELNSNETSSEESEWVRERSGNRGEKSNRNVVVVNNNWNRRNTYHSFNFDIGTNNYLANGNFPDQSNALYSVRPWGSWYVGINSVRRTHVAGPVFLEWAFGVSWYNFKFQEHSTSVVKTDDAVTFVADTRAVEHLKSKLSASYFNFSFVPVVDFGRGRRKTTLFDGSRVDFSSRGNHSSSFRIGAGPYAGYRLTSWSKMLIKDSSGHEQVEKNSNSYFLNNLRYGMRVQFGFDDIDFFVNYDMNELFVTNKGPKLNAISFGVTF